jgi:hypothetical protein
MMLTKLGRTGYCSFECKREYRLQMVYPTCVEDMP